MKKPLPPSQYDVETAERDMYANGDIKALAALLDVDQSYISKQLNADDPEHKSPFYVFVRRLYYADQNREELGDGYVSLLLRLRSRWLGRQGGAIPPEVAASMFAFLQAKIAELPYGAQMKYLDECYLTLDKFKQGLHFNDIDDSELEDNVQSIKRK